MNKFLCMILAAAFCLLMPVTIFADTLSADDGNEWKVTYDASGLSTNFSSGAGYASVTDAMPGDTIRYEVSTINNKSGNTDWYLSNSVVNSLETGNASGGAYTYQLYYIADDGTTTTLYDSTVGGRDGEGLKQVNTTTDGNYFYLGRLSNGQSGTVMLDITLEGHSQTNDYMSKLAQLTMNFAVEEAINSTITRNNTVTQTVPGNIIYLQDTPKANTDVLTGPKTGDAVLPMILSILGIVVGILLVVIWGISGRNRKTAKEEAMI
jgi:hypothetical protein